MASTPFGEHLRRERELRGVSLDEVSAATRIKTSFLEAIENGRWEELPGGAFNRGFIRATSRFLGLDEDGMVAEYALETGAAVQVKPVDDPAKAMPRDYRPAVIAGSVALLLMIAGAWLGHHEYSVYKQKRMATAQYSAPAVDALAGNSAPSSSTAADLEASPEPPPNSSAAAAGATNSIPANPPENATSLATAAPVAKTAAVSDMLTLKIESSKKAEVRIVGDGKTLFKGRLHSDEPKTFVARQTFEVTSGEANRVRLELNGQPVPFTASSGHKGKISLSRKDLKPAGQPSQ
jgi:cytoskeleton protein RodZ